MGHILKCSSTLIFICFYISSFSQVGRSAFRSFQNEFDHNGKAINVNAKIASHRYGADASFSSNTDNYKHDSLFHFIEALHFKYDIGGQIFMNPTILSGAGVDTPTDRERIKNSGRVDFGIYLNLNDWINGDTATLRSTITEIKDSLNHVDNNISTISYRGGDTAGYDSLVWLKEFVGGRTSLTNTPSDNVSDFENFYGINGTDTLGNINNFTGWDIDGSMTNKNCFRLFNGDGWIEGDSLSTLANVDTAIARIKDAINKGGHSDNFTHFHTLRQSSNWGNGMDGFLKKLRDTIDANNKFLFTDSYESIIEYAWSRELIDSVWTTDKGDGLILNTTFQDITTIDRNLVKSPYTITLNTAGSNLEGKNLSCSDCVGIRQISSDSIALDISIPSDLSQKTVNIDFAASSDYYNFSIPTIQSVTFNGGIVSVTTNMPTRATVFYANRNSAGPWEINSNIVSDDGLTTNHTINISAIDESTKDLYIGVISKEKKSTLSNAYKF